MKAVVAQRVIQKVKPGDIILLHDGNEVHHGANRSNAAAAFPEIVETLQEEGYTFVTVPELLKSQPKFS